MKTRNRLWGGPVEKIPDEVVEVERIDGTWRFKIEFQESAIPTSRLIYQYQHDRLPLSSWKSTRIVWYDEWMHNIPKGLDGYLYRNLARTLDAITDPSENVVWRPEMSSYTIGGDRKNHICLELACLDSKGTQCPKLAALSVSKQLADRARANDDGRAELFNSAAEHVGKVMQKTHNSHPDDLSKLVAAVLGLARTDNPFRRLCSNG